MKNFITMGLALTLSTFTLASELDSSEFGLEILAVGKMSGACGIFKLQIEFQENILMPGGIEFIERFWTTEAARLGVSLQDYAKQCGEYVEAYKKFSALLQPTESK